MELQKTYNPSEVEQRWYEYWMKQGFFRSRPNPARKPYTIVIPPPNVTGVLHMGHMLNNTIQDVLIRRARMKGYEACWVPGTDHASIATEAKVVKMLKDQGIEKHSLTREQFLKHAWAWKEKYGGIILEQLKKLGASCDWERTRFTMEEDLSRQVIHVFVELYRRGLIYRGLRMVNWDPQGLTALADDEVIHRETRSKLVYVKYQVVGSDEYLVVATQRPETIMGDVAVAINPTDERYTHLHGKKVIVPLVNREVPIVLDEYVTTDFGTGCLKVTPAHDINDYEIGLRHNLPVIDVLNPDGTISAEGQVYVGMDRFAARKKSVADLKEMGLLVKEEEYTTNIGYSERTNAVVEPRMSTQWFMKMQEAGEKALEAVMTDEVRLIPGKFKNTYRHWMENVRDWCISRQLWWGHRIPAWYLPDGSFVVAETAEEALALAQEKDPSITPEHLRQDDDVLDTWFSSWLWPFSVFNGLNQPGNADIRYYYPTNDLVTAPEILFFWVARMVMAGYLFVGEKPFTNVYLTGIVRDKQGRKMSKSLGNSPEPLELIAQYGADGVRTGMLFSSPAGNDLPFDEDLCVQGRNFCNKIWNAFRLVKGWQVEDRPAQHKKLRPAMEWFRARFQATLAETEDHFSKYRISDALLSIYRLIWDDFCSWYLEMVKPEDRTMDTEVYKTTIGFFEDLMKVLHPFMPFITEELWHLLKDRSEADCIIVSPYPECEPVDEQILRQADYALQVIGNIRNIRSSRGMSPKEPLQLFIRSEQPAVYQSFGQIIQQLANLSSIEFTAEKIEGAVSFIYKADEYFVPLEGKIDPAEEKEKLTKELEYATGFLNTVMKKLSNERFVSSAPKDVVEKEMQKKVDAESKIAALQAALAALA